MQNNPADRPLRRLAVEALAAALAKKPDDLGLLTRRAHELARLGKRAEAIADYTRAAALEPKNARWERRRAQLRPDVVAFWNFDDHSPDGWQAVRNCRLTALADGLRLNYSGDNPQIAVATAGPAGWMELTIRARIKQPVAGRVHWGKTPANVSHFTVIRSQWFTLPASGKDWKDYRIVFHAEEPFDALHIDLGAADGELEVESLTLRKVDGERKKDIVHQTTQAVALLPEDPYVLVARGDLYAWIGQPDLAEADFAAARELDANKSLARHHQFVSEYQTARQLARAAAHVGPQIRVAKGKADQAALVAFRGQLHGSAGQWKAALADYEEATRLDPTNHWYWYCCANLHLYTEDVEGYRRDRQEMQRRFGESPDPLIAERLAKVCFLEPTSDPPTKLSLQLASLAVADTQKHWAHNWFLQVRGLADYRAGKYQSAVDWLRRSQKHSPDNDVGTGCRAIAHVLLSMAYARAEPAELQKARGELKEGIVVVERLVAKVGPTSNEHWSIWVQLQIFRKEAETLAKGKKP
jgi:tetratricopeptide (TPR) repeat protein